MSAHGGALGGELLGVIIKKRGGENESCEKSENATSADPNKRPTLEERRQMSETTQTLHTTSSNEKVETSGMYARSGLYQETRIRAGKNLLYG